MAKRPEIQIVNGAHAGKRFTVGEGGLRLGRSSSNDIHVPDEELSRNHCLFEIDGESSIRLTDLASANGTFLNGKAMGSDPARLSVGDLIEVGTTVLKVVSEGEPTSGTVDLGLNATRADGSKTQRSRRAGLWGIVLVLVLLAGAGALLYFPTPVTKSEPTDLRDTQDDTPVSEVYYEKVEATAEGIFRYELTLAADGVLRVSVDDVPRENRHYVKSLPIDEHGRAELNSILKFKALREIDREYVGEEPDPPALHSWNLRVVYANRAWAIKIVNVQEPEAFRVIREKLETFSKNQLGVWALQYSCNNLIAMAEEAIARGRQRWEDREVKYDNLFQSVTAYREALNYLETINPKPPCAQEAQNGLKTAQEELETRYRDQRFLADRAINLAQWETAQRELKVLLEMIPERTDDRYREAALKLVDVEKRIKEGN